MKNFFKKFLKDDLFEKEILNLELIFKKWLLKKNITDFEKDNSVNLIQNAKIFEEFLFDRLFFNKKNIYKIFKKEDELNFSLDSSRGSKKEYLQEFKGLGYFGKNHNQDDGDDFPKHLKKEFHNLVEKNNLSFEFEGARDESILNAHLNHCLICHDRKKDSCKTGFSKENKKENGCPLEMHISEAIFLKKHGFHLAALAVMMINNPLCILTGYRICNDCNKACIFAASDVESVDVSSLESKILCDVLSKISFGIEIYFLFLKFNPLRAAFNSRLQKKEKLLIVGAGAAGLSAAFHLGIQNGFNVQIFEAAKIEKNAICIKKYLKHPIKNGAQFISKKNDERLSNGGGFGGVCEYGITNRWNKNYLDLLLIFFLRNKKKIGLNDCVRFSDVSGFGLLEAKKTFDHIIFASGASLQKWPQDINFSNISSSPTKQKNIHFAADFLMDLHLNSGRNFAKQNVKLPAIVIGLGLTAADTASALIKFFFLNLEQGRNPFFKNSNFSFEQKKQILQKFGGVKIIYHGLKQESSAYKTNHEEVLFCESSLTEIIENTKIISVNFKNDAYELNILDKKTNVESKMIAKTIFIATGFAQNPILFEENDLDFLKINEFLHQSGSENFFASDLKNEKISLIGDAHPLWRGSVVKALRSGALASKQITEKFLYSNHNIIVAKKKQEIFQTWVKEIKFFEHLGFFQLVLKLRSNLQLRAFKPGNYFKFQNYYNGVSSKNFNSIALTPIWIECNNGSQNEIHFLIKAQKERFKFLKKGDPVCLMGPIGEEIDNAFFDSTTQKSIFILDADCKFSLYSKILLLEKLKKLEKKIEILILDDANKKKQLGIRFYEKKILEICFDEKDFIQKTFPREDELLFFLNKSLKEQEKLNLILDFQEKNLYDKILDLASSEQENVNVFGVLKSKMGCMMKGFCGRCFILKKKESLGGRSEFFDKQNEKAFFEPEFRCICAQIVKFEKKN